MILELPLLLPLIAGALIAGVARGLVVLCSQARRTDLRARARRRASAERLARPALGS